MRPRLAGPFRVADGDEVFAVLVPIEMWEEIRVKLDDMGPILGRGPGPSPGVSLRP